VVLEKRGRVHHNANSSRSCQQWPGFLDGRQFPSRTLHVALCYCCRTFALHFLRSVFPAPQSKTSLPVEQALSSAEALDFTNAPISP